MYRTENNTRKLRMYNIAVAFNELYIKNAGLVMSTSKLRDHVHEKLKTNRSKWARNNINGDYKANGDVIGKHGHNLDLEVIGQTRYVKFNESNKAIIYKFLAEFKIDPVKTTRQTRKRPILLPIIMPNEKI